LRTDLSSSKAPQLASRRVTKIGLVFELFDSTKRRTTKQHRVEKTCIFRTSILVPFTI